MSFCISRADFKRFGCIMIDVIVHVEKNLISIYNTQGAKIFVFLRETNNSHFCCSAQNRGGEAIAPIIPRAGCDTYRLAVYWKIVAQRCMLENGCLNIQDTIHEHARSFKRVVLYRKKLT
jgi:hypothetical protein